VRKYFISFFVCLIFTFGCNFHSLFAQNKSPEDQYTRSKRIFEDKEPSEVIKYSPKKEQVPEQKSEIKEIQEITEKQYKAPLDTQPKIVTTKDATIDAQVFTPKSDLPEGWEEPTVLSQGSVTIETISKGGKVIETTKDNKEIITEQPVLPPQPAATPTEKPLQQEIVIKANPVVKTTKTEQIEETVYQTKSDLPAGWEDPVVIPRGAVKIEKMPSGVKPSVVETSKDVPPPPPVQKQIIETTKKPLHVVSPSVNVPPPSPPPLPQPVQVEEKEVAKTKPIIEETVFVPKSDLPEGWEESTQLPENAVKIEDISTGTTQKGIEKTTPKDEKSSKKAPNDKINEDTTQNRPKVFHRWQ